MESPSHTRESTSKSVPTPRCTQCSDRQKVNASARNLVVCIDGTSNQFGQNNTNVVKLFAKIHLEWTNPEQYAYYSSGIGTRPKSINIFNRMERAVSDKFDMAVAWNMEEIVKDAYAWLARTYQEGDQIYLFGFSRGAYQVRVLAGMIHEVGLIRTPTDKQIGTAYDHYEAIRSGKPKTRQIAREFKNTFSWKGSRVHFVGVWDTVSSVGLIRGDVFLSTSSSGAHACHFRHALALDELRVKFMPEYFHEMNSLTDEGKSKYTFTSPDVEHTASPTSEWRKSTMSKTGTDISEGKKKTPEIKEVWFAGSHSDVGGKNRPGKSHQAGNVSLLWMRQEAAASGLVLHPTDIVWVPDDLDFGISDSMSPIWRIIEYMPIKHQVSFSGAGENDRRLHRRQPRRIIPGQKVHASVLHANAYKPQATLGEGFDIPIIHSGLEDAKLDADIWETGLFDDTAAQELVKYLGSEQGVAPIYLDRLLFMLRFKEGKQCVRNVPHWQDQFRSLIIHNRNCAPLVRLVTIVAYYEASCDPEAHPKSRAPTDIELPPGIFDAAKECLTDILGKEKHRDGPRVVALLRPLMKHQNLRERILTPDVLETLVALLDVVIKKSKPEGNFGQAMDGLNCLLQYADTRQPLITKLWENHPNFNVSRISRILQVDEPHLLTAALRMVLTLARIPEERTKAVWSTVKPRIRKLATKNEGLVGLLAVEIVLALYNPADRERLDHRNAHVRANLAGALTGLSPERQHSADEQSRAADPGQLVLRGIFGLDDRELRDDPKKLIRELKKAVEQGNVRDRTAATMTLLSLCESVTIRAYFLEIDLLVTFIGQLQRGEKALLAAYALVTCLKYSDMKDSIKDNDDLPKHIVGMLRLDYFDDAVGKVEGFQIFRDFMQHPDLRGKIINKFRITEVLDSKLGKGKTKEIRTSLISLDIFRSFVPGDPWTSKLVENSMKYLKVPVWKTQQAGVTILSALAQTEHGMKAILPHISEIVGIILPPGYLPITSTVQQATSASATSPVAGQTQPAATVSNPTGPRLPPSPGETEHGAAAIRPHIHKIVKMLLPAGHAPTQPTAQQPTPAGITSPSGGETQPGATTSKPPGPRSPFSRGATHKPSSWMMGPACALRILAQHEELRDKIRETVQFASLKHLYLSGTLVDEADTSPWRVNTPNRTDVVNTLDKMIKAVDGELSEDGLTSIGDTVLPHIEHWDRLVTLLSNQAVGVITVLPVMLGVSTLAILALIVLTPIYLSARGYKQVKRLLSHYQDARILDKLRVLPSQGERQGETDLGARKGEHAPDEDHGEGPSGGHGGEGSQGAITMHAEGSRDMQSTSNVTSQE